MIAEFETLLKNAVTEVFTTMLSLPSEVEPPGAEIFSGDAHVAGAVGFIGNKLTGVVYIYTSGDFARKATAQLLGIPESEIDGDVMVNDAMGELTNMVVGHVKSHLSDKGMNCVLTIPSIVRGSHFSIETVSTTERRVISFATTNGQVVAEILVKPTEDAC